MPTKVGTDQECYTFGDLKVGTWFISKPVPGDNDGHGGFRGEHYIHIKTAPHPVKRSSLPDTAISLRGTPTYFPDHMEVVPVE